MSLPLLTKERQGWGVVLNMSILQSFPFPKLEPSQLGECGNIMGSKLHGAETVLVYDADLLVSLLCFCYLDSDICVKYVEKIMRQA
jgi:hypothetical protein